VDVDRGQLLGRRLKDVPLIMDVCSLIPSLRMISATEVPDSACLERERNLLFSKMLLSHPKPHPFW
jgi:hypothetical protein